MGPPTVTQRAEMAEEQTVNIQSLIRATVIEEVSAAVKGAVAAMEVSLSNRLATSFEESFKKQERHFDLVSDRLEGR